MSFKIIKDNISLIIFELVFSYLISLVYVRILANFIWKLFLNLYLDKFSAYYKVLYIISILRILRTLVMNINRSINLSNALISSYKQNFDKRTKWNFLYYQEVRWYKIDFDLRKRIKLYFTLWREVYCPQILLRCGHKYEYHGKKMTEWFIF